jgi:hypothetical protein
MKLGHALHFSTVVGELSIHVERIGMLLDQDRQSSVERENSMVACRACGRSANRPVVSLTIFTILRSASGSAKLASEVGKYLRNFFFARIGPSDFLWYLSGQDE